MTAPFRPGQQLYVIVWGPYAKIGCSTDPIDRLTRVTERGQRPPRQSGQPELVGTVTGGYGAEAWLHAALAGHRAAGEWFHLRGPVLDLVQAAATRGVDDLGPRPTRARRAEAAVDQLRPGRFPFAVTSGRDVDELAIRHVALLPTPADFTALHLGGDLTEATLALCGAKVRRHLGAFDPRHVRACPRCRRSLPR